MFKKIFILLLQALLLVQLQAKSQNEFEIKFTENFLTANTENNEIDNSKQNLTVLLEDLYSLTDNATAARYYISDKVLTDLSSLDEQTAALRANIKNITIYLKNFDNFEKYSYKFHELTSTFAKVFLYKEFQIILTKYFADDKAKLSMEDLLVKLSYDKNGEIRLEEHYLFVFVKMSQMLQQPVRDYLATLPDGGAAYFQKFPQMFKKDFNMGSDLLSNMLAFERKHKADSYSHLEIMFFSFAAY